MNFNVRDCGAKCDDVTDDTAAIQAAIDAAEAAGGGIVFFPPRAYRLLGQLNINTNPLKGLG